MVSLAQWASDRQNASSRTCIYMLGSSHIYFQSVVITQNFHFFVDNFDFGLIYFILLHLRIIVRCPVYIANSDIYCS